MALALAPERQVLLVVLLAGWKISAWSNKLNYRGGMCLDTAAECHGKTERRGAGCQIRMEKHVGTAHGKTAEVRECRATMVETGFWFVDLPTDPKPV